MMGGVSSEPERRSFCTARRREFLAGHPFNSHFQTGANTQGATLAEVRENLKEAVQLVLEANRKIAEQEIADKSVIREK
jgi:hypothetical protein